MTVGGRKWGGVAAAIAAVLKTGVDPVPLARISGGCINECYRWEGSGGPLFVKLAPPAAAQMFHAEAEGLRELAQARAVRTPRVLACDVFAGQACLVLEWLDIRGLDAAASARLGTQLARQHRHTAARFGWHRDNTIGSTRQLNAASGDWCAFFRDQRLRFQLELACRNGHREALGGRGARLLRQVHLLLDGHAPVPSLLHGDLWSGNAGMDISGTAVLFDPAVYYGDREADIAMTRLFGGFAREFHAAYEAAWPLPAGAAQRADLYDLYHVLNHLNLFGTTYLGQAVQLIDRLLARVAH